MTNQPSPPKKGKDIKKMEAQDRPKCMMCGSTYPRQDKYFPRSYSPLWFGNGYYVPVCRRCIEKLFKHYMVELNDVKSAFERTCSKFDFYFNDKMYEAIFTDAGVDGIWGEYFKRITHMQWGKSEKTYDDTIIERDGGGDEDGEDGGEGDNYSVISKFKSNRDKEINITSKTIKFWGEGYEPYQYKILDDDYSSWVIRANNGEKPSKALEVTLKEMCMTQLDIQRARIAGAKPNELSQLQNTYIKLMDRAGLSPDLEDSNLLAEKNALGVLIDVWETTEPVPNYPEENKLKKYIDIWFKGHLAKAANLKNDTKDEYKAEIEKYKANAPNDDISDGGDEDG